MNELIVVGHLGEAVDHVLRDRMPGRDADLLPGSRPHFFHRRGRLLVDVHQALTLTYLPGASSIGVSLPPPGSRAGTRSESSCSIQAASRATRSQVLLGFLHPGLEFALGSPRSSIDISAGPDD
jgi:hypothetical protein